MIALKAAVDVANMSRALHRIETQEIKYAVKSALKRAAGTAASKAATSISKEFGLAKWQIMGIGGAKRSKGGRIASTQPYNRGRWAINIWLRQSHVNPAGTNKKTITGLRQMKNGTVRAGKHKYDKAFIADSKWGGKYIRVRSGKTTTAARVEIDTGGGKGSAKTILASAVLFHGLPAFRKRFDHEMKMRIKKVIRPYGA